MMRHYTVLFVFLVLIVYARSQKNVGDSCVDQYTNTIGQCKPAESCESARNDFQQNGIRPTFCTYSAFGATLVCCRDGTTILQQADKQNSPLWSNSNKQTDSRRVSERNDQTSTGKPPVEPYIHDYGTDELSPIIRDTFHVPKPTTPIILEDRDFSIKDRDFSIKDPQSSIKDPEIPAQRDTEEDLVTKIWALKLKGLLTEQRRYAVKIINDVLFEAETGGLTKQHMDILKINTCGESIADKVAPLSAVFRATKETAKDEGRNEVSTFPPILQLKLTVNNPETSEF